MTSEDIKHQLIIIPLGVSALQIFIYITLRCEQVLLVTYTNHLARCKSSSDSLRCEQVLLVTYTNHLARCKVAVTHYAVKQVLLVTTELLA